MMNSMAEFYKGCSDDEICMHLMYKYRDLSIAINRGDLDDEEDARTDIHTIAAMMMVRFMNAHGYRRADHILWERDPASITIPSEDEQDSTPEE